jgi:NADH-quinone oxidoreductase subunit N
MNLMASSRNLLMIYLSLELVSVISFVMAGFKIPRRESSSEAAMKYVSTAASPPGSCSTG